MREEGGNKGHADSEEQNKFGADTAHVTPPSPPGACPREFNTSFNISAGGKAHEGGASQKNTLPSFFVSNAGLCDLSPKGHVDILPFSPPVTFTQIAATLVTQTASHSRRHWTPLLTASGSALQDPACPHMEAFGPKPSLISPLCLLD